MKTAYTKNGARKVTLRVYNGELCDGIGRPLKNTGEIADVPGWSEGCAVYRMADGVEVLIPWDLVY